MISLLQEFMLFGDNLTIDIYKNKFINHQIKKINEEQKTIENNKITEHNEIMTNNKITKHNEIMTNNKIIKHNEIVNNISDVSNIIDNNVINEETNNLYKISQFDGLFWCFYAIKNGLMNYEMNICADSFRIEKEEKFKYIEIIRSNKERLKINKIKSIIFLENELGNEKKISLKTFFALCIVENINIYYVDGRKINFYIFDENLPINVIIKKTIDSNKKCNNYNSINKINDINKKRDVYLIDLNANNSKILKYKQEYLILESLDDKLKSISSYKLSDLIEICNKLNIDISSFDKPNKKDLYSLITKNY